MKSYENPCLCKDQRDNLKRDGLGFGNNPTALRADAYINGKVHFRIPHHLKPRKKKIEPNG